MSHAQQMICCPDSIGKARGQTSGPPHLIGQAWCGHLPVSEASRLVITWTAFSHSKGDPKPAPSCGSRMMKSLAIVRRSTVCGTVCCSCSRTTPRLHRAFFSPYLATSLWASFTMMQQDFPPACHSWLSSDSDASHIVQTLAAREVE